MRPMHKITEHDLWDWSVAALILTGVVCAIMLFTSDGYGYNDYDDMQQRCVEVCVDNGLSMSKCEDVCEGMFNDMDEEDE